MVVTEPNKVGATFGSITVSLPSCNVEAFKREGGYLR